MDKNIKLLKKWLDNPSSVSLDELEKARDAATKFNNAIEYAVFTATYAAYYAAYNTDKFSVSGNLDNIREVEKWIAKYFERLNQ